MLLKPLRKMSDFNGSRFRGRACVLVDVLRQWPAGRIVMRSCARLGMPALKLPVSTLGQLSISPRVLDLVIQWESKISNA